MSKDPLAPGSHPDGTLINILKGNVTDDVVNVDKSVELSQKLIQT